MEGEERRLLGNFMLCTASTNNGCKGFVALVTLCDSVYQSAHVRPCVPSGKPSEASPAAEHLHEARHGQAGVLLIWICKIQASHRERDCTP